MSRLTPSLLALDKGLDLQTAKIIAPEGSVFDTINYEQVDFQGQKRIDGYTRYDGSALSAVDEYRVMVVDSINGPSTDRDLLFYEGKLLGVIGQQENTTLRYVVIDHNIEVFPDTVVQVVGYSVNGESSSWSTNVISDVSGQEDSLDTSIHYEHLLSIMSSLRAKVEELPGPIAGLHWFQDRLYAVADLQTFATGPKIVGDIVDSFNGVSGTYQYQINQGTPPYSVSIVSGNLAPMSSIDNTGKVTFSYTTVGDYSWTVEVVDSDNNKSYLQDSNKVYDGDVWIITTSSGDVTTAFTGNYILNSWQELTNPTGTWAFAYTTPGIIHLSASADPAYTYSLDGGTTWLPSPGITVVSAGGGKMAFTEEYAFLCGGVHPLMRRLLPNGTWSVPSESTNSLANVLVVVDETILAASQYNNFITYSEDNGNSWQVGGNFITSGGIAGSPVMAYGKGKLVIGYNNAVGGGYLNRIRYSEDMGITWSPFVFDFSNPSSGNIISELVFDGTYWIAVTSTGQCARSFDAENWEESSSTPLGNFEGKQAAVGDGITMVSSGMSGSYYTLDHGLTWEARPPPTAGTDVNVQGVAWRPLGETIL